MSGYLAICRPSHEALRFIAGAVPRGWNCTRSWPCCAPARRRQSGPRSWLEF